MKFLAALSMLTVLTTNTMAYSEAKRNLQLSAEGKVSEASMRTAVNGVIIYATVSNPAFGIWAYLCLTQQGPGLNADLDFLTYDPQYGAMNLFSKALGSNVSKASTDATSAAGSAISASAQKSAKLILSEKDNFYADGEATPERTPELHKAASEVSSVTGQDLNQAAEAVIETVERNPELH